MSNGLIPNQLDPRRFVDRALSMSGSWPLAVFTELAELVTDAGGDVQITLQFERDEQNLPVMEMELAAEVGMTCQRCLEQARLPLEGRYQYAFVRTGSDTSQVPQDYDVIELDDAPLDMGALVEEELLLCLPIVPMHPEGECDHPQGYVEPELDGAETQKTNPFSVLAQLRKP